MKKLSLSALVLTGAIVLTMTACSPKASEATPTPEATETPATVETVSPTDSVGPDDLGRPAPTETPEAVTPPAESEEPVQAPPIDAPAPAQGSKVQAVWEAISAYDLPRFMDLDDDLLLALYGIDADHLVEYVGKTPMMNVQATEFLIAQVQPGKLDTVKEAIEARQADMETQWAQYLPEQLELVQNYKLVTNGDYIMFAVTEYADDAVNDFNANTK